MAKYAIHGFYGMGNLGDEAILRSFLEYGPGRGSPDVVVFSRNPPAVTQSHGVRSISSLSRGDYFRRRRELRGSGLFILGGGGLLKDFGRDSASIRKWLVLLNTAKRMGRRTALFAVGVENIRFDGSKRAVREALEGVDLITVRDGRSAEVLKDIGVKGEIEVTTDPAVLLKPGGGRRRGGSVGRTGRGTAAFCVRHWFSEGNYIADHRANERYLGAMAELADHVAGEMGRRVEFIPLRDSPNDDDREVAREIVSRMRSGNRASVRGSVPTVDEFVESLPGYEMLVGMRLHSLILASAARIPVVGLSYLPKVRSYMRSIGQEGLCIDMEHIEGGGLIERVARIEAGRGAILKTMDRRLKALERKAEDNISRMVRLAGGAP